MTGWKSLILKDFCTPGPSLALMTGILFVSEGTYRGTTVFDCFGIYFAFGQDVDMISLFRGSGK